MCLGFRSSALLLASLVVARTAVGQTARVCEPAALLHTDSTPVETAADWRSRRRPAVLELFRRHVYGRAPARREVQIEALEQGLALAGTATRKQWRVRYADDPAATIDVLAYLPHSTTGPTPVFLALNFDGAGSPGHPVILERYGIGADRSADLR